MLSSSYVCPVAFGKLPDTLSSMIPVSCSLSPFLHRYVFPLSSPVFYLLDDSNFKSPEMFAVSSLGMPVALLGWLRTALG